MTSINTASVKTVYQNFTSRISNPFSRGASSAANTSTAANTSAVNATVVNIPEGRASLEARALASLVPAAAPVAPTAEAAPAVAGAGETAPTQSPLPGLLDQIPAQYRPWVLAAAALVLGSVGGSMGYLAHTNGDGNTPAVAPLISSILLNMISVATGGYGVYRRHQDNVASQNLVSPSALERAQVVEEPSNTLQTVELSGTQQTPESSNTQSVHELSATPEQSLSNALQHLDLHAHA